MEFRIKEAREKMGLSQKELSESLGIKPTTFNGYEKGIHDPKSEVLKQIAIKCNTTVDFLLGLPQNGQLSQNRNDVDLNETLLIKNYNSLNDVGKSKLLDYSNDLVNCGNYTENLQKEKHA